MNYFKSLLLTTCALVMLAACNNDDLKDDINDLKDRVESLEAQVSLLNDNMTAIKVLLEGGKTITDFNISNGTYTLKLSDGQTITLTQGSKGEVKYPEITVNAQGQWVVNGSVLMQNGVPVQAVGTPGADGATPKFRISSEGNYWEVSYDNGTSYDFVRNDKGDKVVAVGNGNGSGTGGDNFFEDVKVSEDGQFFMVKLKDATDYISIPIVKDVLCQIVVPEGAMKDGFWEIGYGKTVTATVKVKGENIIATAPNGWTVTVSQPNADTNEATLTITAPAKSGARAVSRATADNSYDVTVQANTGAAWTVDKIQVKAIDVIDSYWEIYNNGGALSINGIEVNNTKFPDGTLIESDKNITEPGVYFLKKGVTVTYNSTVNTANLLFIGDDPQAVSTVEISGNYIRLRQNTEEGHFLCKNISLKAAASFTNYWFTVYADESFANVAFDQCQFSLIGKPVTAIGNNNRSIANFSIENSTFICSATTQQFIINLSTFTNQDYKNIIFKNNIFYCPSGKVDQLVLFNGAAAGLDRFTLENNTFVNIETNTNGFVNIGNLSQISVTKNIFWTNTAGTSGVVIIRPNLTSPTGDLCKENIVYKTMTYNWQMFFGGKTPFDGVEQLNILTADPFTGGTFNLANGKFIPNTEYTGYGASIN